MCSRIARMNALLLGIAALLAWQMAPAAAYAGFWGQLFHLSGQTTDHSSVQQGKAMTANHGSAKAEMPPNATLDGRLVDLREFIMGQYSSPDHVKATANAIKAGMPLALETPSGLVLIGERTSADSAKLTPWACEQVEVKGRLYDKDGVRYMDVASIDKPQSSAQVSTAKESVTTRPSAAMSGKPASPDHAGQASAHPAK